MSKPGINSPWEWRPSKVSWFRNFFSLLSLWHPSDELELEAMALRHRLMDAAENREDWLVHPCLSALTLQEHERHLQRDFQLATWVAAHSQKPLGYIQVSEPLWLWSFDGGCPISPGKYDLQDLGATISQSRWPCAISLDVFGRSIGMLYPDTWAAQEPLCEKQQQQLNDEILLFLRAMHIAKLTLSDFEKWATSVTRVIIPLFSEGAGVFRSSSQATIPGLIFCDLFYGETQILEALAHESSHLYFFLAEAAGPLVDQRHKGLYKSPLRTDPRPLRGIFLAYHALAYIFALYTDLLSTNVVISEDSEKGLSALQAKLEDAEYTLTSNQHVLTDWGDEFFNLTREVAHYGSPHPPTRIYT